jgi:phospho-2-dehydro-3-deoxyheptonate aldolase
MVALETMRGPEEMMDLQGKLEHHWMLDPVVASEMVATINDDGVAHIDELLQSIEAQGPAIKKRDENRLDVQKIFSGESEKKLIILGPCSLDIETDYTELFDYIEKLQEQHPDAVIGMRLNGAKPRSKGGNTGLFPSTIAGRRKKQLDVYDDAFQRGIPIFTEVTDKDQFGVLAPYLTGAWLGARDMGSTDLRTLFSATRLNVMVKNAVDGRLSSLEDAVTAIGKNSEQNQGSGVNLGYIAATCAHEDGGPAVFAVGEGNKNVAIIARGYELREEEFDGEKIRLVNNLSEQERNRLAFAHLGGVCMLAAKLECAALLDGSHKVPSMLSVEKIDGNDNEVDGHRFLRVLRHFREAVKNKQIQQARMIRGYLGEVSVNVGKTDKNLVLNAETKTEISDEIDEFKGLDKLARRLEANAAL